MSGQGSVERIVVVPRNGLANRLQAWASAALMAQDLDCPLSLLWTEQQVAPVRAPVLFDPTWLSDVEVGEDWLTDLLGQTHESLPRYLTRRGSVIVLAGHDRGEQPFMADLQRLIEQSAGPTTIVVIAGGLFHLPASTDLIRRRGLFYRHIDWSPEVRSRASAAGLADSYAALHVRGTDRSIEAPTARAVRRGLQRLHEYASTDSLFIAADTSDGLQAWSATAERLGWQPWSLPSIDRDRSARSGAIDAAADWLVLSRSLGIVHPRASTFSTEAAVAGGTVDASIALRAPASLMAIRRLTHVGDNLARIPRRALDRSHTDRASSSH